MLGLYIHIPFCKSICPYCDFYKMVVSDKIKMDYIQALIKEIKLKKLNQYDFDTIYIGGGTPSCLPISLLETLLTYLNRNINLSTLKEFTIEVNPNDINESLIDLLKNYHITRISIGIQTFNSRLQKIINRCFDKTELIKKIALIKKKGIKNINLDLMYSIPTQSLTEFDDDLNQAIALDVTHLSVYSLILEEHTSFYHLYQKGQLTLNDDDTEAKMYQHLCQKLKKNQFIHYETSNFAKKGYHSLHNLIYWNCEEYLAIGAASASYFNNIRATTTNNLNEYLKGINHHQIILTQEELIDKTTSEEEFIMLGLRKTTGISKNEFALRFDEKLKDRFLSIQTLINDGLLIEKDDYIFIPEKYFYISNHIIVKILSE